MPLNLDRSSAEIVLIVDDVPENLSVLHDALDESGFTVLVAINGESALARARQSLPDIILLDAMMPGMDGFEVARRLKADFSTRHIPIVFMTGLTETEHVVAAFNAGGTDYVTKPVRTGEYEHAPGAILNWILSTTASYRKDPSAPILPLNIVQTGRRLILTLHEQTSDGEWLIVLREENDAAHIEALLSAFGLTRREAEVLYWVTRGKTGPDIGDILGSSPRTVNKHLEHIDEKLGVETRTAAANLALTRLRTPGTETASG